MISSAMRAGFFVRSVSGPPECPTLIFLHGLGESGLCFEPLMRDEGLAGWPRLAIDLPGYGRTEPAPSPLALEEHARTLVPLLRGRRCILVGHSMGGVVATFLAPLLGADVAGFVNIEGNISPADCTFSALVAAQELGAFYSQGFARLCRSVAADGATDAALSWYARSLGLAEPAQLHLNATELVKLSANESLATRMAAIATAKIYILGSPRGTGARSRELLDNAGIAWSAIADAGHWPFIDQTAACAKEIRKFIDKTIN
jgi:pimeloyl-ACP methyl ester carboxylesterase